MKPILDWFRAHLVLFIFGAILVFQYLNWQATRDLANRWYAPVPPPCDGLHPCIVDLTNDTIRQLKP